MLFLKLVTIIQTFKIQIIAKGDIVEVIQEDTMQVIIIHYLLIEHFRIVILDIKVVIYTNS